MWQSAKNVYHLCVAVLANVIHGFPGKKLVVIGVTGTDGKTTTVSLIYHILKTAGYPVSMISTVGAIIHGKESDIGFHVTTPSPLSVQRFLRSALFPTEKKNYLVLEVTSHSLDQHRVWGIPFAIGVLTNVTHEHLDYHKTYDRYLKAKVKLLKKARIAILNKDDMSYGKVMPFLSKEKRVVTYALNSEASMTEKDVKLPVVQKHNQYNMLAAAAVAKELGVSDDVIAKALSTFVFPKGRSEMVYNKKFQVMIDFAHTPNAFEQLLSSLRSSVKGRIIHVFGSAGERDAFKRAVMGEVASKYDDMLILTSEDPRREDPHIIMDAIESGITKRNDLQIFRIADRKEAIQKAVGLAEPGDLVLLTGKAHEKSMNYGYGEVAWDEFTTVQEALADR